MSKGIYSLICIFILTILSDSINSTVIVKVGNDINFSCDRNIYYIIINVVFSEKPPKDYYPFTLNLPNPEDLNFKCMLDYPKTKIYCLRPFSDEVDFIDEGTLFQFPYPFPIIDDIEWDYETFLQKIYRRVWNSKTSCGNENIYNITDKNYRKWDIEGKLSLLDNGQCKIASLTKEDQHRYNFDMTISLTKGEIFDQLSDKKNKDQIELMQEIWVPLLPPEEKVKKTKTYLRDFSYAYCFSSEKINKGNYLKYKLNCNIPIEISSIYNGVIRMNSFFDKLYIKNGNKIKIATVYININGTDDKTYASLAEKDHGIICPNQPIFMIESKDDITMGLYYNETNKYTFFLTGTLINGFYAFKNGTTIILNETYKDISFNLIVQDNLIDSDENDITATCVLPSGTPYDLEDKAVVKCIASKEKKSNIDYNVDITLNWNLKANNNFNDIIIDWPDEYDDLNKKNIYLYQLTGLSIRQSNYGCRNNNFDFYVYIYDLSREPKLYFDLPLLNPQDVTANCQIFDSTALKCTINLKHKKLSKGTKIELPGVGTENEIDTDEGNRVVFTMNNYSEINNENDFYIKTKEECGDYLVVGTLKDMGMSHKTSVTVFIIVIVVICLIIAGFLIYIIFKIRLRYKRGSKLTTSEESKHDSPVPNKP